MSFKTYHPGFESILGHAPSIDLLLEKTYPFAHEAGIYIPETSELFITSNRLVDDSGIQRVEISKIKLGDSVADTKCDEVRCGDVAMANGGVNYGDRILFCAQGSQTQPSGLYITTTTEPYLTEALTTSFYDRPFNSVNDVVVHSDGSVWFTDPTYGHEQGYRPPPSLPPQVYRFSPRDGSIRAMADGFGHPNGICFSPNEKTLYVTDTDWIWGDGSTSDTRVSSM